MLFFSRAYVHGHASKMIACKPELVMDKTVIKVHGSLEKKPSKTELQLGSLNTLFGALSQ